jgi:hypothetical protein
MLDKRDIQEFTPEGIKGRGEGVAGLSPREAAAAIAIPIREATAEVVALSFKLKAFLS